MSPDVRHRAGWIPANQEHLEAWLEGHVARVDDLDDATLKPSVAAFPT